MPKITITASETPRFMVCAPSVILPQADSTIVKIQEYSPDAKMGQAIHLANKHMVNPTTGGSSPDIKEIAGLFGVNYEELESVHQWCRKIWDEKLSIYFPFPKTEQRIDFDLEGGIHITGQLDLLDQTFPHESRFLDWKSNRNVSITSYIDQLRMQALLLACTDPKERYIGILAWIREGVYNVFDFSHAEILEFRKLLIEQATRFRKNYQTGEHCKWCPIQSQCPAYSTMIVNLVNSLTHDVAPDIAAMLPVLDNKFQQIKAIKKTCEFVLDQIRRYVLDNGDIEFEGRDGVVRILGEKTRNLRRLDAVKAKDFLMEHFSPEQLLEAATFSIPTLEKILYENNLNVSKKAIKEWFNSGVADAITITESKYVDLWEIQKGEKNE